MTRREDLFMIIDSQNKLRAAQLFVSEVLQKYEARLSKINEKTVVNGCAAIVEDLRELLDNLDRKRSKLKK